MFLFSSSFSFLLLIFLFLYVLPHSSLSLSLSLSSLFITSSIVYRPLHCLSPPVCNVLLLRCSSAPFFCTILLHQSSAPISCTNLLHHASAVACAAAGSRSFFFIFNLFLLLNLHAICNTKISVIRLNVAVTESSLSFPNSIVWVLSLSAKKSSTKYDRM